MIQNVSPSADAPIDPAPAKKSGCWLYALLGVVGVVLVIGLLLPARRTANEAARNANCKSNLKQIMSAMYAYEEKFGLFPPAYTVDSDGKPLHSWRTLLLPWLGSEQLYESLDLSKPWDDPVNAEIFERHTYSPQNPRPYHCPSAERDAADTTYLAIVTPNSCLRPGEGRPLSEIQDGKSSTLVVIDAPRDHAVPWQSPLDADEALVLSIGSNPEMSSPHPSGFNAAFCDGSVKFFLDTLSAESRRALISIDAGDKVELP